MAEDCSLSSCENLETEENLAFQHRSWRWQTVGRWAVALLVIAAMVGLFGRGPLSRAEAATPDGRLRVEYPRLARTEATYRFTLHVAPEAVKNGEVAVTIDAALLEVLQVESVVPEPTAVELGRGQVTHRFRAGETDGLAPIALFLKASGYGRHSGRIGLEGGASAEVALWLYP